MGVKTNLPQVAANLKANRPKRAVHRLRLSNNLPYVKYLEDRHGYWVLSGVLASGKGKEVVRRHLAAVLRAQRVVTDAGVELALEASGIELLDWLRSTTSEMRPPARGQRQVTFNAKNPRTGAIETVSFIVDRGRPAEGPRAAHPGHWADVTGNLMRAYRYQVNDGPVKSS